MSLSQFYKDMAWNGLLDTKEWSKQYVNATYAKKEKQRIKKVISNYKKMITFVNKFLTTKRVLIIRVFFAIRKKVLKIINKEKKNGNKTCQ